MKLLINSLDTVYYSTIKNIDINIFHKEINIDLLLVENGIESEHFLKLKNCSAFLWSEKNKKDVMYNFDEYEYYELTSVVLEKMCVMTDDEWLKNYSLEYNVVIEIWNSALLVKVDTIVVDDKEFIIKGCRNNKEELSKIS